MPAYTGSQGQSAFGTILAINTGTASVPVWTPVGEVIAPKQSGTKNNFAEATNLQSSAEEFIATIPSPGALDFTMNRVSADTGQLALLASFNGQTSKQYQVTLPKTPAQTTLGDTYAFTAFVETLPLDFDPKKIITYTASLKISNKIVFTAGS
jgi:hypothetical protein